MTQAPRRTPYNANALQLAGSPNALRLLTRMLLALVVLTILALFLVPWQQNVAAAGRVSAFDPFDRIQSIAAPVSGRVGKAWVVEGSQVQEGDRLLEIVDLDPAMIQRLQEQRDALEAKLEAARERVRVYEKQVVALSSARDLGVQSTTSMAEAAEADVNSARHGVEAAQASLEQARLNFDRQRQLVEEELASGLDFEMAERVFRLAQAELDQRRQALRGSLNEVAARKAEVGKLETESQARIESAKAEKQSAQAEVAAEQQQLATLDVRIAQQNTQLVLAPRSGTVFRIFASPGAEVVKAGDPIVALMPDAKSQAVELWVDGNDVPLVSEGRSVRLQFEGWPGVQFGGWPSVAVGTFGGRIAVVDHSGDAQGRFRILVVPDQDDDPWPSPEFLRQGARVNGFVLLDQVRLGYELWRQANGFPPTVVMDSKKESDSG